MSRFLHLITSANPVFGGPIAAAQLLADAWSRLGHDIDLVTLDPPGSEFLPDYAGKIFSIGRPFARSLLSSYRYSPDLMPWLEHHAHNYDAIIVSGLWRYTNRGARKALVGGRTPYFVFTHGMLDPWFRRTFPLKHLGKQVSWWLAEGPLLAHARNVLFTCEEELRQAEKAFWPYRVNAAVVGFGAVDVRGDPEAQVSAFRAAIPELDQRKYLLYLSRIHRKKGIDLLIDAFAAVAGRTHGLDLVIAGPDQMGLAAALREQTKRLGIANRTHFPGMLTGDVKMGAYRAAEAFVLTSHQENFGIVVAEALASGTPVLISDKVNIWREVQADGAGLVEPDTRTGSLRLIERFLLMTASEIDTMRAQARQTFLTRYHSEKKAAELLKFVQSRIA